ncbi:hypothetical protein PNA2_1006 [Pyrococcus sp. NA2]|uniref:hypothetical protein n=1 Tax=Pyrococcus sp. (strain NA2) TaxID=342949 RepID=UPI000209A9ED|nr:hypothetical protein [Pyrococcus sp. NA2]AEC51922.1 hypothetical protein PNA2_1006 [Pyrococcus sp. NA2]
MYCWFHIIRVNANLRNIKDGFALIVLDGKGECPNNCNRINVFPFKNGRIDGTLSFIIQGNEGGEKAYGSKKVKPVDLRYQLCKRILRLPFFLHLGD